jgi:S-formylglutathione hydrolase FrmB
VAGLSAILVVSLLLADEPQVVVSPARPVTEGYLVHDVTSACQAAPTRLRVLLPDQLAPGRRYPTVYVLPVEAGSETRFGDGLLEVQRHDLHNRFQAVFAAPTFAHLPWYANHPTDARIHQETYFVHEIVPAVERLYPVAAETRDRLLLGFSKSGWGAYSLLLRHPDLFGRAAAWDAPLAKDRPDQYGMEGIFASQENFEKYRITTLLERNANLLRQEHRLILTGYGNFRQHHDQVHDRMTRLGIRHEYRDGPPRAHDWHSGWVEETVSLLLKRQ